MTNFFDLIIYNVQIMILHSDIHFYTGTQFLILTPETTIWAMSWETLFMPYANNKGADQPVHPRSLIIAFVLAAWIV